MQGAEYLGLVPTSATSDRTCLGLEGRVTQDLRQDWAFSSEDGIIGSVICMQEDLDVTPTRNMPWNFEYFLLVCILLKENVL